MTTFVITWLFAGSCCCDCVPVVLVADAADATAAAADVAFF